ncbi:MAG: hypothetical protein LQ351_000363 [Letrouitia transgressa]|nr:MAG: hypothetical protein LQ351_000363 [Letrouitia transgressa]
MGGDGPPSQKHGEYMGPWGAFGGRPQKGIITYALAANRQRPFAGATYSAIFNTYRRAKAQFLYVVPPLVLAYWLMNWAVEKNEYVNSKAGRLEAAAQEEANVKAKERVSGGE